MLEIAIMLEGQNGLTWDRWKRWVRAVEDLGFAGLYRSDHFTNAEPPDLASLELWVSLTWLASHTERIQFGQLVSPASFRHPVFLARMAKDLDDLSGGRMNLGMGAGWQAREHDKFGFDLLEGAGRFRRFEEAAEVAWRLLKGRQPVDFDGDFYRLHGARLLPPPARPGGPDLTIGGNGRRRTLPLAARLADIWNADGIGPDEFASLNAHLDDLLAAEGRPSSAVKRTAMIGLAFGADEAEAAAKLAARGVDPEGFRRRGGMVGTAADVTEGLRRFAEAGLERAVFQWLEWDDMAGLERLAKQVLPAFAA